MIRARVFFFIFLTLALNIPCTSVDRLYSKAALPVYASFAPQTPTLYHRSRSSLFLVDATLFFVPNYLSVPLLQILVRNLLVPATIFQFSFWIMKEVFTILITGQRPTCFAIWDVPWHLLHLRQPANCSESLIFVSTKIETASKRLI